MASIALRLKSDPKAIILKTPSYASCHFFSSGSSLPFPPPSEPDQTQNDESTQSNASENARGNKPSFSSYFSDLKSSLKQTRDAQPSQQLQGRFRPGGFSFVRDSNNPSPFNQPPKSFDEISKHLSEFRRQSAPPPPPVGGQSQSIPQPTGISELIRRVGGAANESRETTRPSIDVIRESFRQFRNKQSSDGAKSQVKPNVGGGFAGLRGNNGMFGGSNENLPQNVFGKEIREREDRRTDGFPPTEFMRSYGYEELGEKLRKLRPADGGKKQGSRDGGQPVSFLAEMKERLARLREMERNQPGSKDKRIFEELRGSIAQIVYSEAEAKRKRTVQRVDILGHLGGTPSFMLEPPKEHLVEKYFHPDNMSSAEKLKIQLKKVRDEFRIHESDCGSTQVQIAQLTTEISHLSKSLHKKDKHSRKGLQAKVQQRKTLLRYLRRTDWDSYCFLLSKLGLRDNPGYKI